MFCSALVAEYGILSPPKKALSSVWNGASHIYTICSLTNRCSPGGQTGKHPLKLALARGPKFDAGSRSVSLGDLLPREGMCVCSVFSSLSRTKSLEHTRERTASRNSNEKQRKYLLASFVQQPNQSDTTLMPAQKCVFFTLSWTLAIAPHALFHTHIAVE